jgi:hypothetical protein
MSEVFLESPSFCLASITRERNIKKYDEKTIEHLSDSVCVCMCDHVGEGWRRT